jgi:Uma2 family endonuclease
MSVAVIEKKYTVTEYLELEKISEVRHEFYYGKLIEMPGESKTANRIAKNCSRWFDDQLEEQGYESFTHDVKVQVLVNGIYRYPDVVVAPEADDAQEYIVLEPAIMVEVASENSAKTDRHTKLKEYIALPTLKYYLIIAQYEMSVEVFSREGNRWIVDVFTEINDVIDLPTLGIDLPLYEIYKKTALIGQAKSDF